MSPGGAVGRGCVWVLGRGSGLRARPWTSDPRRASVGHSGQDPERGLWTEPEAGTAGEALDRRSAHSARAVGRGSGGSWTGLRARPWTSAPRRASVRGSRQGPEGGLPAAPRSGTPGQGPWARAPDRASGKHSGRGLGQAIPAEPGAVGRGSGGSWAEALVDLGQRLRAGPWTGSRRGRGRVLAPRRASFGGSRQGPGGGLPAAPRSGTPGQGPWARAPDRASGKHSGRGPEQALPRRALQARPRAGDPRGASGRHSGQSLGRAL